MDKYLIYKLIFPNLKVFIGQTKKSFNKRLYQYKSDAYNDKRKSYDRFVSRAIRKYGWNNIRKEIVLYCEENQIDYYEKELIKLYNSNNKLFGYNLESGGNKNKILSEETKNKISIANTGKKRDDKFKEILRRSRIGKPSGMKHKKHSDESKEKMKKSSKHLSGKNHSMYGKKHTIESKYKMSNSHVGKNIKSINMYTKNGEFIKTFESVTQATILLNLDQGNISKVLVNRLKTTGGYKFAYVIS